MFFHKQIIWLFVIVSLTHLLNAAGEGGTGASQATTAASKTTKANQYKPPYGNKNNTYYGSNNYGYGNNYNDNYGDNYDGNNNDNYNDNYNNNNNNNYGSNQNNYDGIDRSKYGTDMADYGPTGNNYGSSGSSQNRPSMLQSLDLWIYAADDWEKKGSYRGRGNNNKKNNNRGRNYDGDDNRGDYRGKRSYSRVRFPVKQVKKYRQFPYGRFPPLISIFPWLPIFYDKLTLQTFIFSPTGGIYIIPPLINFYGQRFAVAQLIKWGYASLVSTGAPPPPNVDVAPLVAPPPAGGVAAGVVGGTNPGPAPTYDSKKYRFNNGVKTDFPDFKPRYSQTIEEGGDRNSGSSSGNGYGGDSSYGGSRNQQVYAQGNQRSGSGGGGAYNY